MTKTKTNVVHITQPDAGCSSPDGEYIRDSYTSKGEALNDAFYGNDNDFDPDAEMLRQIQREEQIFENQIDDFESDPSKPRPGKGPVVHVGFDSEFLSGSKDVDNTVLSLQFYVVGECGVLTKIVYPSGGSKPDRPSFYKTICRLIIEALEARVILEWPSEVVVCGFFLRIDLPAFGDLVSFKSQLDTAGGRIASINSVVTVEPDPEDLKQLLKNKSFVANDNGFNRQFRVRFIDVGGHVAVGTSLAQMGDLINLPKLLIPEGHSIEHMDVLLRENIAAHTTGFIRAVLSEQIAGVPDHRKVVSATTDGFITDADECELNLSGPMALRFQILCDRVAPGSDMLERKHRVRQLVAMKTRGQVTGLAYDEDAVVLAKAGVSPDVPADQHNDFMLNLFIHRQPGDMTKTRPFTPIRDQWVKNADVVRITREIRLNLEFDFKRQLINPLMIGVAESDHVSLESIPWTTIEEAEQSRALFDGWRRKRCLKTVDDWDDWDDQYQFGVVRTRIKASGVKDFGIRSTKGLIDVFRRLFLRAYTQEICGLTKTLTYQQLADWLTDQGYPTTTDEIKNAKRAKFVEGAVPATSRMLQFASVLSEGFPSIEIHQFIKSN